MNHAIPRTPRHGTGWRKSSYSAGANNCVEISTEFPGWRKSSYSEGESNCVEISTALPGRAWVRDSKLGDGGPVLALTHRQWRALLDYATSAHA